MARASTAGVTRILAVGTDLASSRATVNLAAEAETVFAAVGLHPTEADRWDQDEDGLRLLLDEPKVTAIGEVGLDFVRSASSKERQVAVLRAQLAWAEERGLPVSVHNRGADDDLLEVLAGFAVRTVLHCFSGSPEFAARALHRGYLLSFAGNVTFPRAANLRELAALVPEERLLVESDAPVLAPQPWRGRRNEPAYTRATLETLAGVRGVEPNVLAETVARNADGLFHWGSA